MTHAPGRFPALSQREASSDHQSKALAESDAVLATRAKAEGACVIRSVESR